MRGFLRVVVGVGGLVVGGGAVWGADVPSGPKAGVGVPALRAYGVVGLVEGKEADWAAVRRDGVTVYVWVAAEESGVPKGGRPAARFLKALDEEIGKWEGAAVVAVWWGEKAVGPLPAAEAHKGYLPRFQESLRLQRTSLAVYGGEGSGPAEWGIHPQAAVTVVVANQGRVVRSLGYESVNETAVKDVVEVLKGVRQR